MTRVLVDVDTQRDFMDPAGALYVPTDPTVSRAIRRELTRAVSEGLPVVGSVDAHAHDAWEFADNGGPFPPHCVKGAPGWTRVHHDVPVRTRFVPMQALDGRGVQLLVGEQREGTGNRTLDAAALVDEARRGVGLYFEKEVYSLFCNPLAEPILAALVESLGGSSTVVFDVIGYCTGGYCVDAAVTGLLDRGYRVRVVGDAVAAIGGEAGQARSRSNLCALGAEWVTSP